MNLFGLHQVFFKTEDKSISRFENYSRMVYDFSVEEMISLINRIEEEFGIGRALHKEVMTGVNYLGKDFYSEEYWLIFSDRLVVIKFDGHQIPFNSYLKRKKRNEIIDIIIDGE